MGWAFSVFNWAYALFEVPGGWLGDRIGPRRVLMRVVVWWSFFTAATGWVWNVAVASSSRATLFGAGEAGCFPEPDAHLHDVAAEAASASARRARCGWRRAGAARSRRCSSPTCSTYHVVAPRLRALRRCSASSGRSRSTAGIATIRARIRASTQPSWRCCRLAARDGDRRTPCRGDRFCASRRCGCSRLQYACLSYGWYFYVTWLPTYLREARGTERRSSARCSRRCRCSSAASAASCGARSSRGSPRTTGSVMLARRIVAIIGFVGASLCVDLRVRRRSPIRSRAMFLLGLAGLLQRLRHAGRAGPAAWTSAAAIPARCRAR